MLIAAKDVGWRCRNRLTYFNYAEQRYFAYAITDNGKRITEIELRPADMTQIDAYRQRLRENNKIDPVNFPVMARAHRAGLGRQPHPTP